MGKVGHSERLFYPLRRQHYRKYLFKLFAQRPCMIDDRWDFSKKKKRKRKKCSSLTESVKRVYVPLMIDVRGKEASLFAPTCLSQSQSFMKFGLFEKGGTEFTRLKGRLNLYYISNSSYFSILFSCFFSYFLSLLTLVKTVKFFVCFSDFCWRFVFLCAMTEK